MRLATLFDGFAVSDVSADSAVSGVSLDSRLVRAGDVYLAVAGATSHGMQFADAAIALGASAVAVDTSDTDQFAGDIDRLQAGGIPIVAVTELKQQSGFIAARFYGEPSHQLNIVAVTGTDGKTSVCQFVAQAINAIGGACGYIGTLGWGYLSLNETQLTTPDAVSLQQMLAQMRDAGADTVALEASSHGLAERRLDALNIDIAVLTNFGRDHLDYHKDTQSYKNAKARLFEWPSLHSIVVNGSDEFGLELAKLTSQNCYKFLSIRAANDATQDSVNATLRAAELNQSDAGMQFVLFENEQPFNQQTSLLGDFNIDNLLAAYGVLRALGKAANDASVALHSVTSVPGRMECFQSDAHATAVVDYSHTPQALTAAIAALRNHCDGALWVVFGCGGDRDPGKRGPMGRAAEQADHVVVTDDNPRTEKSAEILAQIVAGMAAPDAAHVIADRSSAISYAMQTAAANDLVLIAGKGHEDYQIVGSDKHYFSDRDFVQQLIVQKRAGSES